MRRAARAGRLVALAAVTALVAACGDAGVPTTERREVGNFSRIEVDGATELWVRAGGQPSVTLRGGSKLLDDMEAEVRGETLVLGQEERLVIGPSGGKVVADVTVPGLEAITASGPSDIDVTGLFGDEFELDLDGSGKVHGTGRVGRLAVDISGSGNADFSELAARSVEVDVTGSADVVVRAEEELDAAISGSGEVAYIGRPRLTTDISGAGDVRVRGENGDTN